MWRVRLDEIVEGVSGVGVTAVLEAAVVRVVVLESPFAMLAAATRIDWSTEADRPNGAENSNTLLTIIAAHG